MSEAAMWDALRPVIRSLDPVRVENPIVPGTPDVNYSRGWIELKFSERWPPRGGPLRVDHFTRQQRTWLTRRRKAGGLAFLLLKVGETEWLLFDGAVAAAMLGQVPRERLYEVCLARWTRLPKTKEICICLLT
jgi:hypothetical protein